MSTRKLLDPEILPVLDVFPEVSLQKEGLPSLRQAAAEAIELTSAEAHGVVREEIRVSGRTKTHPLVRCLIYTPKCRNAPIGAYLHFHGGGYILGSPEGSDQRNVALAANLGIMVVSVDYRLAPEHPAPAALDDGYAVLAWLHRKAAKIGIDPNRIAVGGESAGGGLAAALALHARDEAEYAICFQALTYPMIDDRTGSSIQTCDPLTGEFVWTRERNMLGWGYYLGSAKPAAPIVPARSRRFDGLPPTWISTAAFDLFRDENIEFAQRLLQAGIPTELIVYPRTCHAFQVAVEASVTKQYFRDHAEALKRGLQ